MLARTPSCTPGTRQLLIPAHCGDFRGTVTRKEKPHAVRKVAYYGDVSKLLAGTLPAFGTPMPVLGLSNSLCLFALASFGLASMVSHIPWPDVDGNWAFGSCRCLLHPGGQVSSRIHL